MRTSGLYPAPTPIHPINRRADNFVLGHASRLWLTLTQGDIQRRVEHISKLFTGAGWKNLPQELVDEILGYLLGDPGALVACSLTCKRLFGATRPLIHQRLVCVDSRPDLSKAKDSLFSRRKRNPGAFDRLIDADRLGILSYAQSLTFKPAKDTLNPRFHSRDMQECLPLLRSITKLHTLTLDGFHLHPFVQIINKPFDMFTDTLRHLDIRNPYGTERELLHIICQFPLLEDLTIVSSASGINPRLGYTTPSITQSPPLRGKLVLVRANSRELLQGLAGLPGGLNFRSMVLSRCGGDVGVVIAAARRNLRSISYLWPPTGIYFVSDLGRNAALGRVELHVELFALPRVHESVCRTLRTITSPVFNEFVIWALGSVNVHGTLEDINGWKAVESLLGALAIQNPDFRVVFRGSCPSQPSGCWCTYDKARSFFETYLPVVSSNGLARFEHVPHVDNPCRELRSL